ncbi:hypothetical protein BC834DRAFT_159314 [Gloeopeniophorella convolvens]|nr:hypothetical protein BC834DRAFT_159314 [Gloeopeniophorella convolvens]
MGPALARRCRAREGQRAGQPCAAASVLGRPRTGKQRPRVTRGPALWGPRARNWTRRRAIECGAQNGCAPPFFLRAICLFCRALGRRGGERGSPSIVPAGARTPRTPAGRGANRLRPCPVADIPEGGRRACFAPRGAPLCGPVAYLTQSGAGPFGFPFLRRRIRRGMTGSVAPQGCPFPMGRARCPRCRRSGVIRENLLRRAQRAAENRAPCWGWAGFGGGRCCVLRGAWPLACAAAKGRRTLDKVGDDASPAITRTGQLH